MTDGTIIDEDQQLITRLRSRGPEQAAAIEELRGRLLRGLSRSLNNRYGRPFSAEDIVQEALLKILDSLDQFAGRSRFMTWALTIATRIGISELRRKCHDDISLEGTTDSGFWRIETATALAADPGRQQQQAEVVAQLQRLIDTALTERQRSALQALLSGISTDGIAERLGTNRNAVYKLMHDARIALKTGLEAAGISAEDLETGLAN
jgi:RNA polymerase sigma factor (sigma-70 family)